MLLIGSWRNGAAAIMTIRRNGDTARWLRREKKKKKLLKMVPFSASVTVMIGKKSEEESDDDGGDKVTEGREVEFLVMRVMIGGMI